MLKKLCLAVICLAMSIAQNGLCKITHPLVVYQDNVVTIHPEDQSSHFIIIGAVMASIGILGQYIREKTTGIEYEMYWGLGISGGNLMGIGFACKSLEAPLVLASDGIAYKNTYLAWDEVASIDVKEETVSADRYGRQTAWYLIFSPKSNVPSDQPIKNAIKFKAGDLPISFDQLLVLVHELYPALHLS